VTNRHPCDKDFDDPEVQRAAGPTLADLWSKEAYALFGPPHDTPHDVALWFNAQQISPVLDIGCGTGAFGRTFEGSWFGLDRSISQLRQAFGRRVLADASALPFADGSFPGVVALYVLYFFEDLQRVVQEASRVLIEGGVFGVCAPSRYDCPELHSVLPAVAFEESFASEDIPDLMDRFFVDAHINEWDAPMFDLPDTHTVADYLYAHYYPLFTVDEAAEAAQSIPTPLKLTKRGAWAVGRKARTTDGAPPR
jgi:SAM-dependent methyltransferase